MTLPRLAVVLSALLAYAAPIGAQDTIETDPILEFLTPEVESTPLGPATDPEPRAEVSPDVSEGTGAVLRALDKLNASVDDLEMPSGSAVAVGRIEVTLEECRYPTGDPASDAYAFITIREAGVAEPVFRGWMIAASPALNPMDHPRYDVWVLRCTTA